jgi:glutamate/tyrosine decarboxylase-like PLP-dependent enzyme
VPPSFQSKLKAKSLDEADNSELDQLNNRIMLAVQRGGLAYLSSATLRGKFALRACITNFRTTRDDIDQTLEIVRNAARDVAGS